MTKRAKRWRVCKLDGAWQAFDQEGNLRYAADDWWTVYAFALLGLGPVKPKDSFTKLFGL